VNNVSEGEVIDECASQIEDKGVPNYFGYQRFGVMRPNTHLVGRMLLEGDIKGAVMSYLVDYYEGERDDAREARKELGETMDFKQALNTFPKRLGYERNMIDHLYKHPTDFAGAFRRLHKKLRQMFVHGCQSYIFNLILSRMLEEEMEIKEGVIPLFGYRSHFSAGGQGVIERDVLEEEKIGLEKFKLSSMPELSSRGSIRDASMEADVSYLFLEDGSIVFNFFLPKGNYATMVMREFMKTDPLNY
jgi:tRNA pseudouridine13 synthase